MKHRIWYAIVAMLCCISMLLPLAGCDPNSESTETTTNSENVAGTDIKDDNSDGNLDDTDNPNTNNSDKNNDISISAIPVVGENNHWWINDFDTGITALEKSEKAPTVGENGNWWIGDIDTNVNADGNVPSISSGGNWKIGDTNTGIKAEGTKNADGSLLYFYINASKHLIILYSDGTTKDTGLLCVHQLVKLGEGKKPTCTQEGLTEGAYCILCERVISEQMPIPNLGGAHTPEIDHAVPATCEHPGLTEGSHCAVCDKLLVAQEWIPVIDHNYVDHYCTMCGQSDNLFDGGEKYPIPPKRDLKRYIYNALVRSNATGNGSFYCEDFWIDPESGAFDALSYAVIARNYEIEKTFNCSIRQTWSTMDSQYTEMKAFYDSDQKYEMAICLGVDAAPCATDGLLSDLKAEINTKHINLSHVAFDQNSIEQLSIGGNLYYLSGDMNISTMDTTMCTIFNTDLFNKSKNTIVEELGNMYGDVYKMVEDGKFTFENMMKIADVVTVDKKDDDGSLRFDKGDTIGYYEYTMGPLYYYYSTGMRITDNLDGYPVFEITTEEAEAAYDYIFETFNINLHSDIPRGASGDRAQNFQAGAVLFADYLLWDIRRVLYAAESEVPYGILPISVMNENDPHHCVVRFQGQTTHLWTIPYKRNSIENAAFMFYVMAAYSGKPDSTMDAYYIKTMYMELARDDGSRTSLDIIKGSLEYDIALLYDWGNFPSLILNASTATSKQYDTYTSATAMDAAEQWLQKTIDDFLACSEASGTEANR